MPHRKKPIVMNFFSSPPMGLRRPAKALISALLGAWLLVSCGGGGSGETPPATATSTINGKAVDASTGLGIAGVRVAAGTATATTDATGTFALTGAPVGSRVTVLFTSDSYAEGARIASTSASAATNNVQARLLRAGAAVDVPVTTGGTATLAGSPAQVVLGANSVQRADGSLPTGNIKVSMTPINPAVDVATMPGDLTTSSGGTEVSIESFGALGVQLRDAAGTALNLRAGQAATIRIPLGSRGVAPPASIPLFYFDPSAGRWVQEGSAALAGTAPNQYYQGTVTHFSTWNADRVMDTVRYTGTVKDAAGVPISGVLVQSEGVDYSGTSSAYTDALGNFTLPLRRSSTATIVGVSGSLITNTLRLSPITTDTTVTATWLILGSAGSGVSMKLTWGVAPNDLDSHLITPSGSHVYYGSSGSLGTAPFANLDVDDTSSYGPEVITITKLMVGTYKYYIHNFSGQGSGLFSNSSARVELSVPNRATELYTVPTVGETTSTDEWLLFEMDVDSACNITVRRTNTVSSTTPSIPNSTTPVYCTRP
jgi:uncharacterized protein YfaP (DUF2135 family)